MFIEDNNEKTVSIEKLIHVKSIDDYGYTLKNNKKIHVLQVEPINFNLKTQSEQNVILESYKMFLKQCNFNIQIYVQTAKASAEKHISEVEKCVNFEPQVAEMARGYIEFIRNISDVRGSIVRKFFIVIEEGNDSRINMVIDGLKLCGNIVHECDDDEIKKLFKGCYKT